MLYYFRNLDESAKLKLLYSFCGSLYGAVIWDLFRCDFDSLLCGMKPKAKKKANMNYNNINMDLSVNLLDLFHECILIRDNHLSCSGLDFSQLNCIISHSCCLWIGYFFWLFTFSFVFLLLLCLILSITDMFFGKIENIYNVFFQVKLHWFTYISLNTYLLNGMRHFLSIAAASKPSNDILTKNNWATSSMSEAGWPDIVFWPSVLMYQPRK